MTVKLKYKLPNYIKLPYQFDVAKLEENLQKVLGHFQGVMEANKYLCANNHRLVASVYDHFEQINLTVFNGVMSEDAPCTVEACEAVYDANSARSRLRRENVAPELDERNYNLPTELYTGSYFEEVVKSFKSPAIRVRLTKLKPGKELNAHIDYDPSYAVRIIIPIRTNPGVINKFWRKSEYEELSLEAGCPYFLNTGVLHSVENSGTEDRIALMFSLDGTTDINQYIQE